jgi:hypothetical protein
MYTLRVALNDWPRNRKYLQPRQLSLNLVTIMTQAIPCNAIIDHDNYPIDEIENSKRQQVVEQVRAQLAVDGCAVVRDFFSPEGLDALVLEAIERKPDAYYSPKKDCNIYLGDRDDQLPADHPRNIFLPRTNGFIRADEFDDNSVSRRLYYWEPLKQFLADCLDKPELFIYEDLISNMIVNLGKKGQQFNWHFDTNEFTITLLLKPATSGGHFEYVPNLRTPQDECYDDVKKVLDGDTSRIKNLKASLKILVFCKMSSTLFKIKFLGFI